MAPLLIITVNSAGNCVSGTFGEKEMDVVVMYLTLEWSGALIVQFCIMSGH